MDTRRAVPAFSPASTYRGPVLAPIVAAALGALMAAWPSSCGRTVPQNVTVAGESRGAPQSGAGDWPQFRGSERNGISRETNLFEGWPAPPLAWMTACLGEGYSSPSIAGGRIFAMSYRGGDEVVWALRKESDNQHIFGRIVRGPNTPSLCAASAVSNHYITPGSSLLPVPMGENWANGAIIDAAIMTVLPPNSPSCWEMGTDFKIQSVSSHHPGGAHVLLGDGAVHFISE